MQVIKPDTEYKIEQFPFFDERQATFYLYRTEVAMREAVLRTNGTGHHSLRLLDVGCGLGMQAARLALRGWETYGVDASESMLQLGRFKFPVVRNRVQMARGIAESLPFADNTFDLVMCQGAMDHFADRHRFVQEVARVLKPDGYLVVALANYDSLACRIGKTMHRMMGKIGMQTPRRYRFWGIPDDHTFAGSPRVVKELGSGRLKLVSVHGASMFLFLPPWRNLLEILSYPAAAATFRVVDRLAHRFSSAADVMIATWRKEPTGSRRQAPPDDWTTQSSASPPVLARP
jgi:SAM-dependent methyltransferase